MKYILSLLIAFVMVSSPVKAQSLSDKITFELQGQSLQKGLKEVERLSGFRMAYTLPLVERYKNISVAKGTRTVDETLKLLLANTSLQYVLKANTILLVDQNNPVSKKRKITGVVSDRNDIAIPGVTIKVDGTATGTITDANGFYSLMVPDKAKLSYSFVGMETIKEDIGTRYVINVQMGNASIELKGIDVISTGYQKLPKERSTGSFGLITAKDLVKTPSINIMEKLEGSTPGVNFDIRKNTITIHGRNSFNNGDANTPLIIVDGFPAIDQNITSMVNGTATSGAVLSRINPEDIESITILKDAAAASIWGAKAANGVIVIETKKGKKDSPRISFSTNFSISSPANLNKLNQMSSAEYIDLEKELKEKGFITDPTNYSSWMNFNQNPPVSDALGYMFQYDRGEISEVQMDAALNKLASNNNYNQIKKYLLQNAISQQYNLSVSGGGPTNTYYISSNYSKDIPVFRSNKAENYFLTANLGNSFLNNRINLKIGINYNYSSSQSNAAAINSLGTTNFGLRPYDMLVDDSGNRIERSILFTNSVAENFENQGYLSWKYNPIDELNYSNSVNKDNRLSLNASLDAKITNWLSASVSGTIQKMNGTTNILDELNSYNMRNAINTATTISSAEKLVYGIPYGGRLITYNKQTDQKSIRTQININKSWQQYINLNLLAGNELRESQGLSYQQTRYGYDDDTNISKSYDPTISYNTVYGWTGTIGYNDSYITKSINRFLSYYSNASIGFMDEKYIVSGSVRFDDYTLAGHSRSERARPLWSAGVKWNATRENFINTLGIFSDLGLRGTIGTSGSIPVSGSNSAVFSTSGNDYLTNETYGSILTPADGKVSWELTTTYNTGLDWGLFRNRLKGSVDFYKKNTKDIMYYLPVNTTYGWTSLQRNGATMKGHGVDLGLTGKIIDTKNLNWQSTFNISYNTNEVTDARFTQSTSYSFVSSTTPVVGKSLDYIYAYRWAGLDNTGQSQIYLKDGSVLKSTDYSKTVTSEDLKYMGRTTAPYFGGFMNSITYKNLTLSANITYALGYVFRRQSISNYPQWSGTYTGVIGAQKDLSKRWRNPGDENTTNVPGLEYINYNSYSRYMYSDILVEDASNIKLRQVALNYSVPSQLLKKTLLKSLTAGFTVRNLGMLWAANKEGIDPDYVMTNTYTNLAPPKTYYFSLNMTF